MLMVDPNWEQNAQKLMLWTEYQNMQNRESLNSLNLPLSMLCMMRISYLFKILPNRKNMFVKSLIISKH